MIKIFSKDNCPQCSQVKLWFQYDEIKFKEIVADKHIPINEIKATFPDAKSFPIVQKYNDDGSYDLFYWKDISQMDHDERVKIFGDD